MYASLAHTMALSHLKPDGYELISSLYEFYCPSVQSKVKQTDGHRYQCQDPSCKKLFTTLELAMRHIMLSGHSQVQVQTPEDDDQGFEPVSDCEPESEGAAVIPDIRAFLGSQYYENI